MSDHRIASTPERVSASWHTGQYSDVGIAVDAVTMLRLMPTRWLNELLVNDWVLEESTCPGSRKEEAAYLPTNPNFMDWGLVFEEWKASTGRRKVWRSAGGDWISFHDSEVLLWLAEHRYDEFLRILTTRIGSTITKERDAVARNARTLVSMAYPNLQTEVADAQAKTYYEHAAALNKYLPVPGFNRMTVDIKMSQMIFQDPALGQRLVLKALGQDQEDAHTILHHSPATDTAWSEVAAHAASTLLRVFTDAALSQDKCIKWAKRDPTVLTPLWSYLVGARRSDTHQMGVADAVMFHAANVDPGAARSAQQSQTPSGRELIEACKFLAVLSDASILTRARVPGLSASAPNSNNPVGRFIAARETENAVPDEQGQVQGLWFHEGNHRGTPVDLSRGLARLDEHLLLKFEKEGWKLIPQEFVTITEYDRHAWEGFSAQTRHGTRRTTSHEVTDFWSACPTDAATWMLTNHRSRMMSSLLASLYQDLWSKLSTGATIGGLNLADKTVRKTCHYDGSRLTIANLLMALSDTDWSREAAWAAVGVNLENVEEWDITPTALRHLRALLCDAVTDIICALTEIAATQTDGKKPYKNQRIDAVVDLLRYLVSNGPHDPHPMLPSRALAYQRARVTAEAARAHEFADPVNSPAMPPPANLERHQQTVRSGSVYGDPLITTGLVAGLVG